MRDPQRMIGPRSRGAAAAVARWPQMHLKSGRLNSTTRTTQNCGRWRSWQHHSPVTGSTLADRAHREFPFRKSAPCQFLTPWWTAIRHCLAAGTEAPTGVETGMTCNIHDSGEAVVWAARCFWMTMVTELLHDQRARTFEMAQGLPRRPRLEYRTKTLLRLVVAKLLALGRLLRMPTSPVCALERVE